MSIDLTCYSFNPNRADENWKSFPEDVSLFNKRRNAKNESDKDRSALTEIQKLLEDPLFDLFNTEDINHDTLIWQLKVIDLYYGGVPNIHFEDERMASFILNDLLAKTFNLKEEDFVPLVSELVNFYDHVTKEDLIKLGNNLIIDSNGDLEAGIQWGYEFLASMKPVIKDLKENPNSILLLWYGGDNEFVPKSSEKIMLERALAHIKQFQEILPSVL